MKFTKEELLIIGQAVHARWMLYDGARMETRPGSLEERTWLEAQQAIEVIQGKIAAAIADFVTPTR